MSFQFVRGIFEARAMQDLKAAGVAPSRIFFDGIGETPGKSDEVYARVSLSFANTVQDTVSCEGLESLRGSISINIYTPKNRGSKPGEDIACEVMKGWQEINKWKPQPGDPVLSAAIRNIEGPITIAPDQRPHTVHNVNCMWLCRPA